MSKNNPESEKKIIVLEVIAGRSEDSPMLTAVSMDPTAALAAQLGMATNTMPYDQFSKLVRKADTYAGNPGQQYSPGDCLDPNSRPIIRYFERCDSSYREPLHPILKKASDRLRIILNGKA